MAPAKGTKRAAPVAKEQDEPVAKILKQQRVSKTKFNAIRDAINHTLAEGLSDQTRKMLVSAVPLSLCIPADQRHDIQSGVVEMIGEVITTVTGKLQEAVDGEGAKLEGYTQAKQALVDVAEKAGATESDAASAVEACKTSLAEKTAAHAAAGTDLATKKQEQEDGDAAMKEQKLEKEAIEAVIATDLAAVTGGNAEGGPAAEENVRKVTALAAKLKFEASMLSAMPSSLGKTSDLRGPFDNMVLQQLGENFNKRVGELAAALAAEAPASGARGKAVSTAEGSLQSAKEAMEGAAAALTAAEGKLGEAKTAKEAADSAVADYEPTYAKAEAELKTKRLEMESFSTTGIIYEELKKRLSKAAQDAAAPEAEAEAAGAGA
jgi:chromosome segregation ATPase